jgi:Na+/H+ antiporter NhaD/arsenite permease-like protein
MASHSVGHGGGHGEGGLLFDLPELFGFDPALWLSTLILIVAYAFIITEKINRAIISMLGAGMMITLGVINQHQAVTQGIDFNTLFLLIGMMAIVGITRRTGVFQFVAIYAALAVKGNPRALLAVLAWVTALFSALLDNVTTVMLIVPVTLLLVDQLKLKAYPFLFSQIFASNVGGMATLIGDPPNILIGSAVGFSFMDFVYNVGPASLLIMIFLTVFFDLIWGRKFTTSDEAKQKLKAYKPKEAITDYPLLWKSLAVILIVLFGFIAGHGIVEPGTVALSGAALLMLLECIKLPVEEQSHKVHDVFTKVEWETIFFFLGLFVLVYGVEHAGLLNILAEKLMAATEGDMMLTGIVVLWSSAIFSAIVDNIPFVATMIPLIQSTAPQFGGAENLEPLWWCLSLGACLGGNGSLVGASANVMVASFAERAGQRISFLGFMKLAFPLMIVTIAIAHVVAYFMFLS